MKLVPVLGGLAAYYFSEDPARRLGACLVPPQAPTPVLSGYDELGPAQVAVQVNVSSYNVAVLGLRLGAAWLVYKHLAK